MATPISEATLSKLRARRGHMPAPAARSKYGNRKVVGFDLDGSQITFDSAREAKRWAELVIRQRRGDIYSLQRQVVFKFKISGNELRYKARKKLGREVTYVADFTYSEVCMVSGRHPYVVEDAKGMKTDVYKLKWALMKACHGIEVREV